MARDSDNDIRQLHKDVARRQYYAKAPQPIAEALSGLLAKTGYAQLEAATQRDEAWASACGSQMATHSRIGNIRRGVVEVLVRNSAALQELTFQKKQLLKSIVAAMPDQKIRDLRFRIGAID